MSVSIWRGQVSRIPVLCYAKKLSIILCVQLQHKLQSVVSYIIRHEYKTLHWMFNNSRSIREQDRSKQISQPFETNK